MFNFRLAPIEEITPWGQSDNLSLHWFGLTEGCYWLRAGDTELLRYNQQFLELQKHDSDTCKPYVSYQVVRLWEDTLNILPDILSPIPPVLAEKFATSSPLTWRTSVEHWVETKNNALWDDNYENATEWIRRRYLDAGYLTYSPNIWFWNDGAFIHIEWDNREHQIDGVPVWSTQNGRWQLSVEEFLNELRRFNTNFIQAMQNRVTEIAANWPYTNIHIDKNQLTAEQSDRSTWLDQVLNNIDQKQSTDWDAVLRAIAFIDSQV